MTAIEFRESVAQIPYGKELPMAKYVYWSPDTDLPGGLSKLLSSLHTRLSLGTDFNVVKFSTRDFAISFLSYPEFFENPHPPLHESVKVNLATGKTLRLSFSKNPNRPILHRKEAFLAPGHTLISKYSSLTRAEEKAGLYNEVATIGFEQNWRRLLERKGLAYRDNELVGKEDSNEAELPASKPTLRIARHRTALIRDDLSKPVKLLLQYDLLHGGRSLFDYGLRLRD
jgi:hypothetical protein